MKTNRTPFIFLVLVLALILPACGKKSVKSEQSEAKSMGSDPEITDPSLKAADEALSQANENSTDEESSSSDESTSSVVSSSTSNKGSKRWESPYNEGSVSSTKSPKKSFTEENNAGTVSNSNGNKPVDASKASGSKSPTEIKMDGVNDAKGGMGWLWWLLLLLLIAGGVWYYVKKKKAHQAMFAQSPNPPLGGLSPISGYVWDDSSEE